MNRGFRVHARCTDRHHARFVEETSFAAAAVAYLEHFEHEAVIDGDCEVQIIVHDLGTGQEHCFKLSLDTGA